MAAQKGRLFLIAIYNGATYDALATARSTDFTIAHDAVDVTNKGSNGARTLIEQAGVKAVSLSIEGVYEDSAAEDLLTAVANSGALELYEITDEAGNKWAGQFQVTNYQRGGAYNAEETFSASFESSGTITYTPAA